MLRHSFILILTLRIALDLNSLAVTLSHTNTSALTFILTFSLIPTHSHSDPCNNTDIHPETLSLTPTPRRDLRILESTLELSGEVPLIGALQSSIWVLLEVPGSFMKDL